MYCALIGYIHYEAPVEEQNFSTLIEFINAMEVREDDEEFKNPVDLMFDALEAEKPNHFAVRQYKKYKLAAGVVSLKRLLNHSILENWSSKLIKKSLETYFLSQEQNCTFLKTFQSNITFYPLPPVYSVRNFFTDTKSRKMRKVMLRPCKKASEQWVMCKEFFSVSYTNLGNRIACP